MKLSINLPLKILYEGEVSQVSARGIEGPFTILPRHINYVSVLVPGILSFQPEEGDEEFMAVDEGLLVKMGSQVTIVTHSAVRGPHLGEVQEQMREAFARQDEQERRARSALTRLEADFVRRYLEIGDDRRG